jgi:ankyrin repeat protein
MAVDAGALDIVTPLLEKGADRNVAVESGNKRGHTPLFFAAVRGHQVIVQLLVKQGKDLNTIRDFYGDTVLQAVVTTGRIDIVRWLLEKGADPNEGGDGWTSLHRAAVAGHLEIVILLLESGSQLDPQTNKGWMPLLFASEEASILTKKISLMTKEPNQPEYQAERIKLERYAKIIQWLLAKGADPNKFNYYEHTAKSIIIEIAPDLEQLGINIELLSLKKIAA